MWMTSLIRFLEAMLAVKLRLMCISRIFRYAEMGADDLLILSPSVTLLKKLITSFRAEYRTHVLRHAN